MQMFEFNLFNWIWIGELSLFLVLETNIEQIKFCAKITRLVYIFRQILRFYLVLIVKSTFGVITVKKHNRFKLRLKLNFIEYLPGKWLLTFKSGVLTFCVKSILKNVIIKIWQFLEHNVFFLRECVRFVVKLQKVSFVC